MAAAFLGAQWTVLGTATSLTTIIGRKAFISELKVQNADASVNPVYVGPATVTNAPANAYGKANSGVIGGEYSLKPSNYDRFSSDAIFLVGTANAANIAFVTVVE